MKYLRKKEIYKEGDIFSTHCTPSHVTGAFRPHTCQLHSISCSTETYQLAGPCYITTLHSIYNLQCALMCKHSNARKYIEYQDKNLRKIQYTQTIQDGYRGI